MAQHPHIASPSHRMPMAREESLLAALSGHLDIDTLPRDGLPIELCIRLGALPLKDDGRYLHVAVATTSPSALNDQLQLACGREIIPYPVDTSRLSRWLISYMKNTAQGISEDKAEYHADGVDVCLGELAYQCTLRHASDLHIAPDTSGYAVRIRIDGMLYGLKQLSYEMGERCMLRLKLLAGMNVAECRLPQDGALSITLPNAATITFRMSTLPTVCGEKATLRLISSTTAALALEQLGMDRSQLDMLRQALNASRGLILVCGPTGSGKTNTLYSSLMHIDRQRRHVVSAENPVEYPLPHVTQVQTDTRIGLDFATILRAFLRQDPDVMMIGEIRDAETADITLKAAQTGHLVLATVHATSASTCWARLRQLGITEEDLDECLSMIIAQRLVPKPCQHCLPSRTDRKSLMEKSHYSCSVQPSLAHSQSMSVDNCPHCSHGYDGRQGIFELQVPPFDYIKALSSDNAIKALMKAGMKHVEKGTLLLEDLTHVL